MILFKKVAFGFLALAIFASAEFAYAATYPTEISYIIVNNSNVNLTGIPAHTTVPASKVSFPSDRPWAYSLTFGVEHTLVRTCVGVGINNFSGSGANVGAYALTSKECAVTVDTKQNSDTEYTVIVSDS